MRIRHGNERSDPPTNGSIRLRLFYDGDSLADAKQRLGTRGARDDEAGTIARARIPRSEKLPEQGVKGSEGSRGVGRGAVKGFGLVCLQVLKIQGDYIVSGILHVRIQRGWEPITYPCELTNKCLYWYTAHTC